MQRKNVTMILGLVVLGVGAGLYFAANIPETTPASIVINTSAKPQPATTKTDGVAMVKITAITPDISNSASAADAAMAQRTVKWETSNFPSGAGVDVNLVRKVSEKPLTYKLVRGLATNIPSNSQATWIPAESEKTDDLYIEVVCSNSYEFKSGCNVGSEPMKVR